MTEEEFVNLAYHASANPTLQVPHSLLVLIPPILQLDASFILYVLIRSGTLIPFVQVLIEVMPDKKHIDALASRFLPAEEADQTRFSELASHYIASHLLEEMLRRASDTLFRKYYTQYFRFALKAIVLPRDCLMLRQALSGTPL